MESVIGGILIGLAVTMMLLFNGRVAGISGILGGFLQPAKRDWSWRMFFLLGLLLGGAILKVFYPQAFQLQTSAVPFDFILAGFLVGFGTLLGNGCTSGHGVCGLSRFSKRSFLATLTFISFGILSVLLFKFLRGQL